MRSFKEHAHSKTTVYEDDQKDKSYGAQVAHKDAKDASKTLAASSDRLASHDEPADHEIVKPRSRRARQVKPTKR